MKERENQIEEMARYCCNACELGGVIDLENNIYPCAIDNEYTTCHLALETAEAIYNVGYRKQEWISVEERLPEPQKLVLCIWERVYDGWNYGFARYQREDVWYVSNEGMPRVTHWMPLPEAPKMKGGAE